MRVCSRRIMLAASTLGVASVALRLYLIWSYLPRLAATENQRAALALATRGTLADPFVYPTGPTAHVAPLYPAIIALGTVLSGDSEIGLQLARSLAAVVFGLFIVMLPKVVEWMGMDPRAGLLTAIAFSFPTPPAFTWIELGGQHETVFTTVLLAVAVAWTLGSVRKGFLQKSRAITLGILWTFAAHASPVVLLPLIVLLVSSTGLPGVDRSRRLRFGVLVLTAFAIGTLPWSLRNASVLGGYSFIRDNFGLELAVSNSDESVADAHANIDGAMRRHPYFNRVEADAVRALGERAYYAERRTEAIEWIRAHPRRFSELTAQRVYLFFVPRLGVMHHTPFYLMTLLLAPFGMALGAWRRRHEVWILAGVLLAFAAPYFLVQSSIRYSYPVLWIQVLFASSAFLELWDRFAPRVQRWRASRLHA